MEAYVIVAAIVAGLLLNAWNQQREHLTMDVQRAATNVPALSPSVRTPPSFDNVIKLYRDNYLSYKMTGRNEHKNAYLMAQAQIEKYINDAQAKVNSDAQVAKKFVQDYANSSTQLQSYKDQASTMLRTGPELGDQYMLEKKIRDPIPVDMKPLYIKLGVAGLIAAVGVVALLLK